MKKDNKDFKKELDSVMASANNVLLVGLWIFKIHKWYKTTGKVVSAFFGAIIGSAWASTLIIYICTDNAFWLKLFFGVIAVVIILMFQTVWIDALLNQQKPVNCDMAKMDRPNPNDVNLKFFDGYKNFKYRITDPKHREYNKEFFLYPVYARLNGNGSIMFFKTTEIRQTNEEK